MRSPGAPLHDSAAGINGLIKATRSDFAVHCSSGFDAVMPGNENDRPCILDVDVASTATMAYVMGRFRREVSVPFGVNVFQDSIAGVALAAATGANFLRETFTGYDISVIEPAGSENHVMVRSNGREVVPVLRDRCANQPGQGLLLPAEPGAILVFDCETRMRPC